MSYRQGIYRIFPFGMLSTLLAIAVSCGSTEKTERVVADIEAAQMEGRNSARDIINKEWRDTVALEASLKAARAQKLRYDSTGHPECGAAFDTTFLRTIRAVKPELERLATANR